MSMRNKTAMQKTQKFVTRTQMRGSSLNVPHDPPHVTLNPWNAITVVGSFDADGDTIYNYDVSSLYSDFANQIGTGLFETNQVQFRILKAMVWLDSPSSSSASLEVTFCDLDAEGQSDQQVRSLSSQEDVAGKNHFSALGFVWPMDQQNNAVVSPITGILRVRAPPGNVITHVHVLWKSNVQNPILRTQTVGNFS